MAGPVSSRLSAVSATARGHASRVFDPEPRSWTVQTQLVASNVSGTVVKGSGHWLMEEARDQVVPVIVAFLG